MSARPAFAVAMPVCGYAECVGEALASLAAQSWPVRVALLDATPDDSVQAAAEPWRTMIAWGYHRADGGQSAAINAGWRALDGEILAWLNADDLLFPDSLEIAGRIFAAEPDTDVVYGHAVHLTWDGRFIEYFPAISDRPEDLRTGCCIVQPSCFVRRRAVERAGWLDEDRHYTMDWDLWCRLLDGGARFRFVDRPLSLVRLHAATKTASGRDRRFREIAEIARRHHSPLGAGLVEWRFRAGHLAAGSAAWGAVRAVVRALRPPRTLFGLETGTNRMRGACVVHLAWLRETLPAALMIEAEGAVTTARLENGPALDVAPAGEGSWRAALPPVAAPGRVVVELTGPAVLRRAWLEPAG